MCDLPGDQPSFSIADLNGKKDVFLKCNEEEEEELGQRAISVWSKMRDSGLRCDSFLKPENGPSISVHRAIMASCSPYFNALYNSNLNAGLDRRNVTIPGVTYDILWRIVHFAYTGIVLVTEENASRLLPAADQFNMVKMVDCCCDFILNRMTPTNCIGFRNFAKEFFCKRLEEEAHKFLMSKFVTIAEVSEELLKLPVDEAIDIFSAEELNVSNEKFVWEAIIKWIEHNPDVRKEFIVDLLRCVRLGLLESNYFMEQVKNNKYVISNENCKPVIIETMRFIYDLQEITSRIGEVPTPLLARPRIPDEIMFAVGGWSGGAPTNIIETYDTRADRWIQVEEVDPNGPRAYHKCSVIGHDIYVIGGFNGNEYFSSCKCFNVITKKWREVAPMESRRCYVSTAVVGSTIYAIGGYDGHHRQNTAEKYDYIANQWSSIGPMNAQRSDACATSLSGIIYITGGFNGTECLSSCECYDPDVNEWQEIGSMRSRRSGVSCIAHAGHIYALGGFNGISRLQTGEKYNPEANQWTNIPSMFNPRSNFAIEIIDDLIFVVGGFNGSQTIFHVECFDEQKDEWLEATDMNTIRSALAACVVKGLPNIADYIHKNRENLMEEKRQRLLQIQQSARNSRLLLPHQPQQLVDLLPFQVQDIEPHFLEEIDEDPEEDTEEEEETEDEEVELLQRR